VLVCDELMKHVVNIAGEFQGFFCQGRSIFVEMVLLAAASCQVISITSWRGGHTNSIMASSSFCLPRVDNPFRKRRPVVVPSKVCDLILQANILQVMQPFPISSPSASLHDLPFGVQEKLASN
jgi:hypothetical protein